MLCNDEEKEIPQTETEKLKALLHSVFKKSEEEYQDLNKSNNLKSPQTKKMINDRKTQTHTDKDKYQQQIGPLKTSSKMSGKINKPVDSTKTTIPVISGQAFKDKIESARKNKTTPSPTPNEKTKAAVSSISEPKESSNVISIKSHFPVKKSNNMRNTLLKNAKAGNAAMQPEHLDKEMKKNIIEEVYNRFDKKEELLSVISNKFPDMSKSEVLEIAKETAYSMEKILCPYSKV